MKVKYNIRAKQLLDVVNEIKNGRIILSPYFQRNYVWRDIHKVDFIDTIRSGLPFPEIFLAKGEIDVDTMQATSCVVDGQQRLSTIRDYTNDEFEVNGDKWSDLTKEEKGEFLRYEIAVIELDLKHDDPLIQDIFMRLNRTYYSLSNIEKLSSEYAHSEIMILAKYLIGEFKVVEDDDVEETHNIYELHPVLKGEKLNWMLELESTNIKKLIVEGGVFSEYEISRQVHLMFMLNILGTIQTTIFNRNIKKEILDRHSNSYPNKQEIVKKLDSVCGFIINLGFDENSYWLNKANVFSLIIAIYNNIENIKVENVNEYKQEFVNFEKELPEEYRIAAKEGVNNKKERLIRDEYIVNMLIGVIDEVV